MLRFPLVFATRGLLFALVISPSLPLLLSGCTSGEKATRTAAEPTRHDSARIIGQVETDLVPQLVEGGMLIAGGGVEAGVAVLESILPRTAYPAPIHERIARAWFNVGQMEDAARHIDSAITLGGPSVERLLLRGRIRNTLWDDPGAIIDFTRVLTLDPENLEALYLSARIMNRIEPDRSIEQYRRILELRPDDLTTLKDLYHLLGQQRNHTEAVAVAERIYAIDPDDAEIASEIPFSWLAAGEVDRAIEWFRRVSTSTTSISGRPTPLDRIVDRLTLLSAHVRDSAIERFSRSVVSFIVERSQERTFPLRLMVDGAIMAYRSDEREAGDTLAERILDRQSLSGEARIAVARSGLAVGSYRIAIRFLEGLPTRANDPEPGALLGKAYLAEGRLEEAEQAFSGSFEEDPTDSGPLLGLARLHALRDDPSGAIRMFEQAVALDPANPEVITHYAWYLAITGRHVERGYQLVRAVVPDNPDNPDLLEAYAMLAWLTGKPELAESVLTTADIEHPLTPWGLSVWGDIYASHDRIPMALELWRRGLEGLEGPQAGRGPVPEVGFWKESLREELLKKINSYGG